MVTADFHMHTNYSQDSESLPEDMIKASIIKGLKTICITDHYDQDYLYPEGESVVDCAAYFNELETLKEKYSGQIDVRIGIELGLQSHLGAFYKQLVNEYPFDFVIGSVHVVRQHDLYEKILFEEYPDDTAFGIVFDEMLEDIKAVSDMDVLGHLDYMIRYSRHGGRKYTYEGYKEQIDEILKYLIAQGKGIELNMSGFKYGLGTSHPHPDVLKRYRELGGEIITIGADAHKPEHIAYDFQRVGGILKDCGFKYYTEFKERKAIFKQLS